GDLAVALRGVAVAGREERAVERNRQEERRPGDELLAVDVPAPSARRPGGVDARLGRRHAENAEERREVDLAPLAPPPATHALPMDGVILAPVRHAPAARLDLVHSNGKRLPRPRS